MDNEIRVQNPELQATLIYSLIPLTDFRAILSLDDREDTLSRYCLTTATYTIERYCMRRLLRRKNTGYLTFTGDYIFSLREYPVREVLAVYALDGIAGTGEPLEPDYYRIIPDLEGETGEEPEDMVYSLSLSPALFRGRGLSSVKVVYRAGYVPGETGDPYGIPADLASACLELAAWNMARYRGRRIGMTGNIRGSRKDGEHLELSMPENVRRLLEPYRRRTI
jgi:uncharacterized phiE125 gp8 family phage protein